MSATQKKIAVIGAGISGLAFTYRLQKTSKEKKIPFDIHLFEKENRPGGTIFTEQRDGFILEKGPDGFLQQKTIVRDLALELGIDSELITTQSQNRRSMILQNNQLVEVPDGFYLMSPTKIFPFLRSPLLSWKGKFRTLCEPLIPAKKNEEDESLASFVTRRFGKENLEKISQAMLGGIYTADPEHLSMQAALPRFVDMEKKYGSILRGIVASMAKQTNMSGARYGLFGSFKNGMSTLVTAMSTKVDIDHLHLNTKIQSIVQNSQKKWDIKIEGQDAESFDQVIFCTPPHKIPDMMPSFNHEQKNIFKSIPFASSGIFQFGFKDEQILNKPAAVGFIVPHQQKKHFIACSFMSNKYENRAPLGYTLIRIFVGGALQEKILDIPSLELKKIILKEISEILKIQGEPCLEDFKIWPQSMPQYTLGHHDRIKKIQNEISKFQNLHILGNGYEGVGIPDLIEKADQLAYAMVTSLLR